MGKKKVLDQDCEMKVDKKEKKTKQAVCDNGAEKAVQKSSSHEKKKKKKDKQVESPTQHDKKGGTKQDKKSKKRKAVEDVIIIEDEAMKKSPSSKKKKKKQDTQVEAVLSTKGDSPLTDEIKPKKSKKRTETEDVTVFEHAGIQEELAKKTKKASRKERKKEKSSAAVEEGDKTKKSKKSTKKKKGKDATVVDDDEPSSKIKEADPSVVAESLETPDGLQNGSDAKQKKKSRKRKSTEDKVENAEVEGESQETSTKKRKKEKEKQSLSHSEDGTTHAKDEGGKSKKKKKKQKDDKPHSVGDVEKLDKTERKKQKEKNLKKSESTSDTERPKKKKKKKLELSDSMEKKPQKADIKDSMINSKSTSKTDVKSEKKAKKRKYKEIEEVKEDKQPSSSEPKAKKDKKKEKKKNTKGNAENKEHVNSAASLITVKQEVNEEKVPSKRKRKSSESWDYGKYTNNGKTKQYGSVEYTNVGFNYDNSGDDNVTVVSVKEGNPDGLGELEREKRRELQKEVETVTGKREDEQKEKIKGTESPTPIVKTGQWSTASLGSVERQQKFFRLLGGMKSTPDKDNQSSAAKKTPLGHNQSPFSFKKSTSQSNFSSGSPHSRMAMDKSEESSVNKMLETQFQTAMDRKVTKGKVSGLGYIAQEDPKTKSFFIDKNASKSIKFDD
ncbi:PREDICTED: glutamic acid-rich protein-like [Branchiostoma belcheri]|uniref:Glutamic acid-rich protein-like n=1 Tax=Branchiostoma belcheri TaxID=7741 RepID=A0A6P5A6L1_BRABE|nr:PREDICTED: glutamic acid-rich protein-like [Branchiostoma belcheri]